MMVSNVMLAACLLHACVTTRGMRINTRHVSVGSDDLGASLDDADAVGPRDAQCSWPAELSSRYSGQWVVGRGANACVYLADDRHGTTVAIKTAKAPGTLGMWRGECAEMQELRLQACRAGAGMLTLAEHYLPTCLEVGGTDEDPFYVMHAAGPTAMEDVWTLNLTVDEQKTVFAQMVAAIYALHGLGVTHNDLHGGNIVLAHTDVSIIDFGSMEPMDEAWVRDYKRDGNAIWRWGAVTAGCPEDAGWRVWADAAQHRQDAGRFFACIREKWAPSEDFMHAMSTLVDADIAETIDQHVGELYNTDFVQQHLPPSQRHYSWDEAAGCLSWSEDQFTEAEAKAGFLREDLSGLEIFKCETLPTDGLSRPCRDSVACFSLEAGVSWSCVTGTSERSFRERCIASDDGVGGLYHGACLTETHPQHDVARVFNRATFVRASTTTTTTVLPDAPIGGHKPYRCESIPTWDPVSGLTCSTNPHKVACFSLVDGVIWSCGGDGGVKRCTETPDNTLQQNYHGACMMEGHLRYADTFDYDAASFIPDKASGRRRRRTEPEAPGSCRRRRCSN